MHKSIFVALFVVLFFDTTTVSQQQVSQPYTYIAPLVLPDFFLEEPACPVLERFEEARQQVLLLPAQHNTEPALYVEWRIHPSGWHEPLERTDYTERSIPLVLFNTSTCELRATSLTRKIEGKTVPTVLVSDDGQFLVAVESRVFGAMWNMWNTSLTIVAPSEWIVAALQWERYPSGERIAYSPGASAVLSAFPWLADIGLSHFKTDKENGFALITDVPSLGVPGMTVAEANLKFFPTAVDSISIIEQVDDYEAREYREGRWPYNPFKRPLGILATNPNQGYLFTRSRVGARGLMQIMPETCTDMRSRYRVDFPQDCLGEGHAHPVEIATAALVLDYHLSLIRSRLIRRGETPAEFASRPEIARLLKISYNSGPNAAVRAHKNKGVLLTETAGYLQKAEGLAAAAVAKR